MPIYKQIGMIIKTMSILKIITIFVDLCSYELTDTHEGLYEMENLYSYNMLTNNTNVTVTLYAASIKMKWYGNHCVLFIPKKLVFVGKR